MSNALKDYFKQVSLESIDRDLFPEVGDKDLAFEQVEIYDATDELDESEEIVEELDDVIVGLESLVDAIAATRVDGGLSHQAATFAHREAGIYLGKLGLESKACLVSVESFGGDTARLEATDVSIEGLKETLGKLKEAQANAFARAANAQKDFWGKYIGGMKKLQERIGTVRTVLNAASGQEASDKVKISGGKALFHGGKFDIEAVKKGLEGAVKIGNYLYGEYVEGIDKYYQNGINFMHSDKAKGGDEDAAVEKFNEETAPQVEALFKRVKSFSDEMSGGYQLREVALTGKLADVMNKGSILTKFAPTFQSTGKSPGETAEIDVPSIADLSGIVDVVEEVVKLTLAKGEALSRLAENRKAYVAKIKEDSNFLKVALVRWVFQNMSPMITAPVKDYAGVVYPACRSALQLVETCAKAYKDKADSADKGDAE